MKISRLFFIFVLLLMVSFPVFAQDNHPPVINWPMADNEPFHIWEGKLLTIDVDATDPDGDVLTYSFVGNAPGATISGNRFSWTPSSAGEYPVQLQVSDGTNPSVTRDILIKVEVLRFPMEDLHGEFFGAMIGGRAFEMHLGQPKLGETILEYKIVSGPGIIETITHPEWGENVVYRWTPVDADAEVDYQVTITMTGGPSPITSTFTVNAHKSSVAQYNGQLFQVMIGDKPLDLNLGPPNMGDNEPVTYTLSGKGTIETITHPEWGENLVYRWSPGSDDAGIEYQVTITMSGVGIPSPISGTFTVKAEMPHFPLQDMNGEFFGAMIGGRAFEMHLGQPKLGETILEYKIVSGPGKIETITHPEWGENVVYRWTPVDADAEVDYQVTITMTGGPSPITSTFTVNAHKSLVAQYNGQLFQVMIGEKPLDLNLGPPDMGDNEPVTYTLVSGPGKIETMIHPEWGENVVYRWSPGSDDAGAEYQVTITMSGVGIPTPITGTFTVKADMPHFPLQDMNGEFFGAMIGGKEFEMHLGESKFGETPLTYTLVSGPGKIETRTHTEWGEYVVYLWSPVETDAETEYKVTITMTGGPSPITSTFTVRADKAPLSYYNGEFFQVMIGIKPLELHLGPPDMGDKEPVEYTLVSGPGTIERITHPEWGENMVYRWTPGENDVGVEYKVTITMSGGGITVPITGTFTVKAEVRRFPLEDYAGQTFGAAPKEPLELYLGPLRTEGGAVTFTQKSGQGSIVQDIDLEPGGSDEKAWLYRWTPQESDIDQPPQEVIISLTKFEGATPVDVSFFVEAHRDFDVYYIVSEFPDTEYVEVGELVEEYMFPVSIKDVPIQVTITQGPGRIEKRIDPESKELVWTYIWQPTINDIDKTLLLTMAIDGGEYGSASGTIVIIVHREHTLKDFLPIPGELITEEFDDFYIFLGPVNLKDRTLVYTIVGGPPGGEIIEMTEPEGTAAVYHWNTANVERYVEYSLTLQVTDGKETVTSTFRVMAEDVFELPIEKYLGQVLTVSLGENLFIPIGPPELDGTKLIYALLRGPGAIFDETDPEGNIIKVYQWRPSQEDVGQTYIIELSVTDSRTGESHKGDFTVIVEEPFVPAILEFADNFSSSTISADWTMENPDENNFSLTERADYLRIYTKYSDEEFHTINNRLTYAFPEKTTDFTIIEKIDFNPTDAGQVAYMQAGFSTGKSAILAYGIIGEMGKIILGGMPDAEEFGYSKIELPSPFYLQVTRSADILYFSYGSDVSNLTVFNSVKVSNLGYTINFFTTAFVSSLHEINGTPQTPSIALDIDEISVSNEFTRPTFVPVSPVIIGISPAVGVVNEEVEMRISGENFQPGLKVSIGKAPFDTLKYEVIVGTLPAKIIIPPNVLPVGVYDVQVTNPDGLFDLSETIKYTVREPFIDTKPPVFVENPHDVGVTQTSATINWRTNEPTWGTVYFGTSATLIDSVEDITLASEHFVMLDSLEPGTEYYYIVSIFDEFGNGPVRSSKLSFITASEFDTIPAVIVEGPFVQGITMTEAAVIWYTDEPATSDLGYRVYESSEPYKEINFEILALKHVVRLLNLSPDTKYEYRVSSIDAFGNMSDTLRGDFRTKAAPDTISPRYIKSPIAGAISDSSARIIWTTDELSDSYVEYGLTNAYEYFVYDSVLIKYHSVFLPDLQPGMEYHYRIRSTDRSDNAFIGKDRNFITKAERDTIPPFVTEGPSVFEVTQNSVKIGWRTDELSDSFVRVVRVTEADTERYVFSNPELVHDHFISVTGLTAGKQYSYIIRSKDQQGNVTMLKGFSLKTLEEADVIPPKLISRPIVTGITDKDAIIMWKTDENSTSEVFFATDSVNIEEEESIVLTERANEHVVHLAELESAAIYYYKIRSVDVNGNVIWGPLLHFRTRAAADILPPIITEGPIVKGITEQIAVILWQTDEPAMSAVSFNPETESIISKISTGEIVKYHRVTLTGLTPDTRYIYRITSEDMSNNTSDEITGTFKTRLKADTLKPVIINGPIVFNRDHNSAAIKWITNKLSSSFVEYGITPELGEIQGDVTSEKEHMVILTNLTSSAEYFYRVFSIDQGRDTVLSEIKQFKTRAAPDTIAPVVLTGPVVIGRTKEQVTIKWETDEPSDSRVEFGTTVSYDGTEGDEEYRLIHVIRLTNLLPGTEYHYSFSSTDHSGHTFTSDDFDFETLTASDEKPPVILERPVVAAKTHNAATIVWRTDEPSDSFIRFGLDTTLQQLEGDASDVTEHKITLTDLTSSTIYYYWIQSTDASDNLFESHKIYGFKTLAAPDTVPPVLVAGPEEIAKTDERVAIRWETDELADGYVEFGETSEYDDILGTEKYTRNHIIKLTNLTPDREYHYRVISTDMAGKKFESDDFSFKTDKEQDKRPPVILTGPVIKDRTRNSATIIWSTDEVSDSFVLFGADTTMKEQVGYETDVVEHTVSLTNLVAETIYYFRVKSEDPSGNVRYSRIFHFKTKAAEDRIPPRWMKRPNVVNRTHTTTTIQWETDEISDSFVEYGIDSTNLELNAEDAEKVTVHSILLTNLSGSTPYYYRVRSTDFKGNTREGIIRRFVTRAAPDEIPPVILKGPIAINVTHNTAMIVWETDERTSSFVMYGKDSNNLENKVGSADLRRVAKVSLTNLESDTQYYVAVISQDISRNEVNTWDNLYSFYTKAEPDVLPPDIIEGPVVVRTTENSAVIKWKTNEPSNSIVEYGTDETYADGPVAEADNVIKHRIILNNLLSDTEYFAYVRSTDINGNVKETKDAPINFRTKKEKDKKKPKIIKGPIVTNLSTTDASSGKINASATIEWVTDEPADGFVKFGTDKHSLSFEEGSTDLTLEHSITMTNLEPGKRFFYVVASTDIDGNTNEKVRIINKFNTPRVADTKKPVIIEGPIVFATERSASFEWSTDELSDSFIYYGIADSIEKGVRYEKVGSADLVTKHNVVITNLLLGEEYIFIMSSTDRSNNPIIFPEEYQGSLYKVLKDARIMQPPGGTGRFRTSRTVDNKDPVIIGGPTVVNKTATTVTVEWTTDEQSNSTVDYGTSQEYGLLKQAGSNVTAHSATLTNLNPATTYNYRVGSTDINRNGPSLSLNAAVTTEAETDIIPPQITAGPEVTSITDNQATIIWETDEPSDSYVEFTLDSTFGRLDTLAEPPETRSLAEDVTYHRITLTNLLAATTYYFRVASVDIGDNGPTFSADTSFTTAAEPDITPPNIIDSIRVASITDKSVTIKWKTDELSDSFVMFSKDTTFKKQNALRKGTNYYEYEYDNNVGSATDVIEHEITLTNLDEDADYIFTVGSVDKSNNTTHAPGISLFKTSAAPDTAPPEVPEDFAAVGGNETVYLKWSEVPNTAGDLGGYNVYRKAGEDWPAIATNITDIFYYDTGLDNDSTYSYYVRSVDNVYPPNESDPCLPLLVNPSADYVPTTPITLSPVNSAIVSNTLRPTLIVQNSMTIKEPLYYTGSLTYTFAVATDSTFLNLALFKTGIIEGQNTTSHKLEADLENYMQYYWRVRSNDGIFDSPWSDYGTFNTDVPVDVKLAVFTGKTVNGIVKLNWETASEEGNAGFNIYRSRFLDHGFEKINRKLILSRDDMNYKYTDTSVEPGNSYYYKLESINILGITEQYEVLQVTVLVPQEYALHQNYPNPFNPTTTIRFDLPKSIEVVLKIYNILGQEVKTLVDNRQMDAGFHNIIWDGTNKFGLKVASGIYFYRIQIDEFVKTRKMTFLK